LLQASHDSIETLHFLCRIANLVAGEEPLVCSVLGAVLRMNDGGSAEGEYDGYQGRGIFRQRTY